ncbi:MAG: LysR family transcriptional regulator [Clostridiales bacterium]|nr:LysR family transcriptional regulator [Clostridiales bacterium]MDY4144134.1 LysR family transcriptional regulator [Oscillospiraceae bacterium]
MDLRTLKYFTVVAEELNITHAAERLCMSQPPLSNQMKALEEELGVKLFIRGKRQLQLTDAGRLLLLRATQILDMTDKAQHEVMSLEGGMSGTINLGIVEGRAPFLIARWISGFKEEFPKVKYSMWNGSSDDVLDRLRQGLVDLAVIAAPYDTEHLEGITVGRGPWVAIMSRTNELAQIPGDEIPLQSLAGKPLIVPSRPSRIDAIRAWFAEADAEPNIICTLSNYLDAVAMSELDIGITIFPRTTYTPNDLLVTKIITEPARQIEYVLVRMKNREPSELMTEFINFVRDTEDTTADDPGFSEILKNEYVPPEDTPYL